MLGKFLTYYPFQSQFLADIGKHFVYSRKTSQHYNAYLKNLKNAWEINTNQKELGVFF